MRGTRVRWSDVVSGGRVDRLDAEYFVSDIAEHEERLAADGAPLMADFAELVDERLRPPSKDATHLVTYVEIGDLDLADGFVAADTIEWRSAPSRARVPVKAGVIGLSSVRPNRNQAFMSTVDLVGGVCSTGFVMLRPRTNVTDSELFVILKSQLVREQLVRRARASMYPTLHPPDVLDVRVPVLSARTRAAARRLIGDAVAARGEVLEALGVLRSAARQFFDKRGGATLARHIRERHSAVRRLTELRAGSGSLGRLDAEYHQGSFDVAFSEMRAAGPVRPLGELAADARRGRSFTTADLDFADRGGPAVLQVGALTELGVRWSAVAFANGKRQPSERERIERGDVVFNAAAHEPSYIAHRVSVVEGAPSDTKQRLMATSHVMYVRPTDRETLSPHYLAELLRHPLGAAQVRRCIRGVRAEVYAEDVMADLLVPIPPHDVRRAIEDAASRAAAARWRYADRVREAVGIVDAEWSGFAVPAAA